MLKTERHEVYGSLYISSAFFKKKVHFLNFFLFNEASLNRRYEDWNYDINTTFRDKDWSVIGTSKI